MRSCDVCELADEYESGADEGAVCEGAYEGSAGAGYERAYEGGAGDAYERAYERGYEGGAGVAYERAYAGAVYESAYEGGGAVCESIYEGGAGAVYERGYEGGAGAVYERAFEGGAATAAAMAAAAVAAPTVATDLLLRRHRPRRSGLSGTAGGEGDGALASAPLRLLEEVAASRWLLRDGGDSAVDEGWVARRIRDDVASATFRRWLGGDGGCERVALAPSTRVGAEAAAAGWRLDTLYERGIL